MMLLAPAVLAAAVGAVVAAVDEVFDAPNEVSLLQHSFSGASSLTLARHAAPPALSAALTLPLPAGHYETGGMECGLNHSEDLYTYIPDVLAAHPGVDGYCYFELHAPWMAYYGKTTNYVTSSHDSVLNMRSNPVMCPLSPGPGKGPLIPLQYGDVHLLSHVDCVHMLGDDIYCHALGWVRDQRLDSSLMANATAWEELAAQECKRFNDTYHFTREEVTVGRHLDDQGVIWSGPKCTQRNLVMHAYHKCALGHAADEMAYCMSLSCMLPGGNVIGHGPLCEQPPPGGK